jgi:prephenate dehydrogenase
MFTDLLLAAGAHVDVVDSRAGGDITAIDDRLAADLAAADVVVLAVPEAVALQAVGAVAGALRPGALLVDTLSVKGRIVDALRLHAGHLEALSLNPMFAPSLGMAGRPIAAVVVRGGSRTTQLLDLLDDRGARLVEVTAAQHDRLAAATQALTHATVLAFGLALADLGVDVAELRALAPPPHVALLSLLARVASGEAHTYWDIQASNPEAGRARAALAASAVEFADLVGRRGESDLGDAFAQLRDLLGADLDRYADLAAQTFQLLHQPDQKELV